MYSRLPTYLCDLNLAGLNVNLDQMHFYFTILMHKMNLRYANVSLEKTH